MRQEKRNFRTWLGWHRAWLFDQHPNWMQNHIREQIAFRHLMLQKSLFTPLGEYVSKRSLNLAFDAEGDILRKGYPRMLNANQWQDFVVRHMHIDSKEHEDWRYTVEGEDTDRARFTLYYDYRNLGVDTAIASCNLYDKRGRVTKALRPLCRNYVNYGFELANRIEI